MPNSFQHAASGMAFFLKTQFHARVHLGATLGVCLLAASVGVSRTDWCWLIAATTIVWTAEALNTAIELLGDVASGGAHHPLVGRAKDVAAAGVLLAAMGAALIGVIILLPQVLTITFGEQVR